MGPDDQDRFTRCWTQAQPAIAGYIAALVPDPHAADDVVQEVAVILLRKFAEYDPARPFIAWAMGVAKGREAMRAEAHSFPARLGALFKDSEGRPAKLRHVVAHKAIRVEGDRAWNTGFWFETTNGGPDGSIALPSFGVYEDALARVDGRWLFTRRKIYNEFLPGRESGPVNPVLAMDAAPAE